MNGDEDHTCAGPPAAEMEECRWVQMRVMLTACQDNRIKTMAVLRTQVSKEMVQLDDRQLMYVWMVAFPE